MKVTWLHVSDFHIRGGGAYDRAIYATIDKDSLTVFPVRYENQPREVWTIDPSLFPAESRYEKSFAIPQPTGRQTEPTVASLERPPHPTPFARCSLSELPAHHAGGTIAEPPGGY